MHFRERLSKQTSAMKRLSPNAGMTLLELAVVMVIIAILAQVLGQIIYPDRTPLYQTIVGLATMTLAGYVGSLVAKWLKKSIWG